MLREILSLRIVKRENRKIKVQKLIQVLVKVCLIANYRNILEVV
jgi:hypothetical protein